MQSPMKGAGSTRAPRESVSVRDFKVKVAVRVRPSENKQLAVHTDGPEVTVSPPSNSKLATRKFIYDRCFSENSTQRMVYDQFGSDIVDHTLEGYNACIFAYGQTGSGKSFTMLGTKEMPGLIPNICQRLFDNVEEVQTSTAITIRISFLEIYNEQVRDLLTPSTSLRVRGVDNNCYVEGLSEYKVTNVQQIYEYLERGAKARSTAATKMNDQSSRSHAVVSLTIKQQVVAGTTSSATEEKISVLRLVDLAGSERAGSTGATGDRLKEGSNINKSLVTLGRVISMLAQQAEQPGRPVLVPYRESILTRLLQNSLGGNSRTAMIACVAPDNANLDQTISTLRYADQAKKITTQAQINQDLISSETQEARVSKMQRELNELRQQLTAATSAKSDEKQQDDARLTALIQFYEDEAAREKVRSNILEAQAAAAERHSLEMADYIRELTGKGLSSIDLRYPGESDGLSFDKLLADHDALVTDVTSSRAAVAESAGKWRSYLQAMS